MRILTFTSLFPNAVQPLLGVFVYQRVAHLARRPGNTVRVVAPVPYVPSWLKGSRWGRMAGVPRVEKLGQLEICHPRYPLLPKVSMPLHGLLMYLGSVSLVSRLNKAMNFDCIDAHYIYPDGFAAVLLGKHLGIPVIASARGSDIHLFPSFPLIRPMIRWTLERATGLVAVSGALKAAVAALGVPREKIQVIGNGVDLERFQPLDRIEARRQLALPEDAQILVAVGALVPVKGYQFLVPAFAEIAPRYPKLRLYIVGEGASRRKLEALCREQGMADRIRFVGARPNEELRLWFSAADLSCLVSSREGWPNVLLESLACGTPVVATRVWGVPEIIVSPELGLMVGQDPRSIADGLDAALQRHWDRETMVRHARARTWDLVAAEVERYLASVTQAPAMS